MLSATERGIYIDLMRLAWEHGLLPNDMDRLRRLMLPVGDPRQYKKAPAILEQFFKRLDNDGRWYFPGFGDHHQQFLANAKSEQSPAKSEQSPAKCEQNPAKSEQLNPRQKRTAEFSTVGKSISAGDFNEEYEAQQQRKQQKPALN
jgi:hypothetical protein